MGKNEENTQELDVIETNKEETEVVEKKSIGTKIGETAAKIANSKVCRTVGKVVVIAGAVAGGVVLGKHLNKNSDEADDYYDAESEDSSSSED